MTRLSKRIDSKLPLALLRAVQHQDTPPELLPEENPSAMFPNRLGLSGVIEEQIRRLHSRVRRRKRVEEDQVRALLELISRRSDATEVFSAAGRELASFHFSGPLGRLRRLARRLPGWFRRRAVINGLRRANGTFVVATDKTVDTRPVKVRATDSLLAQVGSEGTACQLYSSLAVSLVEMIGAGPADVVHTRCQARGDEACVWEMLHR